MVAVALTPLGVVGQSSRPEQHNHLMDWRQLRNQFLLTEEEVAFLQAMMTPQAHNTKHLDLTFMEDSDKE